MVIAAEIVTALQTVVSRASDPTDPAVLTIGTINGGTRRNIIADRVVLEGTVRTLSEANQKKIRPLMESVVRNITEIYGAEATSLSINRAIRPSLIIRSWPRP